MGNSINCLTDQLLDLNDDDESEDIYFFNLFGNTTLHCQQKINEIHTNIPLKDVTYGGAGLTIQQIDSQHISNEAWEVLGSYIAKNNHLEHYNASHLSLTDVQVSSFFKHLNGGSSSLQDYICCNNSIGVDGIKSMMSFLQSSSNLSLISLDGNGGIQNEGFELIMKALDGGNIEDVLLGWCNIDSILILDTVTLPKLRTLRLARNGISIIPQSLGDDSNKYVGLEYLHLAYNYVNNEGCEVISKLLMKKDASLKFLDLSQNEIDDDGAELLATSLKHNTTLTALRLSENGISEDDGFRPFLKMLNDISSIENTYKNSNHTLKELVLVPPSRPQLEGDGDDETDHPPPESLAENSSIYQHIQAAIQLNVRHGPHQYSPCHSRIKMNAEHFNAVGKAKIIQTQLNSHTRNEISVLQDTPSSLFYSEDDDVLLPEVLALVGKSHGRTELYRMLLATVPALVSIMNREMKVRDVMDLPYTMDR